MEKTIVEKNLIKLLKSRKTRKEGVDALIMTYQKPLYWHIRKLVINHDDSNDVLQEVFLRVWRNIDRFNGESKLFTWLYRIATNEAIRFLEKKQRLQVFRIIRQEMLEKELETGQLISVDEIQLTLQKAVIQLTERQRLVFNMRYFDELDYADIAEILKTTVNNVKVLYHNAKSSIEEQIKRGL
jgi:RNA polymerase sigma-70 factor (ECF subfamily)